MKKFVLFLLTAVLLFVLSACSDREKDPTEVITEAAITVTEPVTVYPSNAKTLTKLSDFNGFETEFAYADAVFYVQLTDKDSNLSETLQLNLPAAVSDSALTAEGILLMADMNFDGDTDIGLLYNTKSSSRQYYCFLWNKQTQTLTYNEILSSLNTPSFDPSEEYVCAVITDDGERKKVYYKWDQEKLKEIKIEEPTAEKATEVELSAEAVAEAAWALFEVTAEDIEAIAEDTVNGTTVTVFGITTENGTVHLAANAVGSIYIDEDLDGYYQTVDVKNGKYYIGASLNSGYDSDDYLYFAKQVAALEVGEDNVGSAKRSGTDYVDGRLVLVYKVSVYDNSGSVTVAFDDTLEYYYLLSSSGNYNTPNESTTIEEESSEEVIFPDETD